MPSCWALLLLVEALEDQLKRTNSRLAAWLDRRCGGMEIPEAVRVLRSSSPSTNGNGAAVAGMDATHMLAEIWI
ncbi:hypothetical protein HJFPF1_11366 [Paramyrothecium foliicola]|nr:hypothetical protein HJFPF1_11366 [Paramyrothecium foliicola]